MSQILQRVSYNNIVIFFLVYHVGGSLVLRSG